MFIYSDNGGRGMTKKVTVEPGDEKFVCQLFKLLGDPNRLKIVCALMGTEECVADLAGLVGMEQSALSHQLKNLKDASLVKSERRGQKVAYSLDDEHIYEIIMQALDHAEHIRKGE